MPYDPVMVQPMRQEMTAIGFTELMSADDVDTTMTDAKEGTTLLVVNSVCGCAAGQARPALRIALQSEQRPNRAVTVFAGQDLDATKAARGYFGDYPPSSPSMVLFKDGEVAHFVPRHMIESRSAEAIAFDLVEAFEKHCAKAAG